MCVYVRPMCSKNFFNNRFSSILDIFIHSITQVAVYSIMVESGMLFNSRVAYTFFTTSFSRFFPKNFIFFSFATNSLCIFFFVVGFSIDVTIVIAKKKDFCMYSLQSKTYAYKITVVVQVSFAFLFSERCSVRLYGSGLYWIINICLYSSSYYSTMRIPANPMTVFSIALFSTDSSLPHSHAQLPCRQYKAITS